MRKGRNAFVVGTAMAAVTGLFLVTTGKAGEAGHPCAERHGHQHAKMANDGPASEDHLAMILEHHPEADADGDGVLTKDEAKTFMHGRACGSEGQGNEADCHGRHGMMIHKMLGSPEHLARILEHHPEADANGDGILSKEEAEAFVGSRRGDAGGCHGSEGPGCQGKAGGCPGCADHGCQGKAGGGPGCEGHGCQGHAGGCHGQMGAVGMVLEHLDKLDTQSGPVDMILSRHPEADSDGDGVLNSSEWAAFAKEVRPKMLARLVSLAPEVDANGDGAVDNAELAALRSDRSAKMAEHVLQRNPDADTDGDGVLSEAELEAFHSTRAKAHHAMILEHHPEADTDTDGVLSGEEARAFFHSRHGEPGGFHGPEGAKCAGHGAR